MKKKTGRNPMARTQARRCTVLSCLVILAGATVTARAAQIQLVQAERWKGRATDQTVRRDTLPAARGGIFDRNGRPLAVTREEYDAYFAPGEVGDRDAAVEAIVRTAGLDGRAGSRLRRGERGWVPIGRVDGRVRSALEEGVPGGVHFEPVVTRVYPEGSIARSLLGTVDERGKGRTGLEYVLDSLLVGTEGEIVFRTRALTGYVINEQRHRLALSIEIEDNGPGVAEEIRDSIFYPLVTGREDGTGLGLPLAQDLVSRHGGLIEFESQPGRTVFMIRLPQGG